MSVIMVTVLGWFLSPIITLLLPKILVFLGPASDKLLELEIQIIPELKKAMQTVDQEDDAERKESENRFGCAGQDGRHAEARSGGCGRHLRRCSAYDRPRMLASPLPRFRRLQKQQLCLDCTRRP
ncbi:hypothetical protein ZWY2020_029088 [Hordeum vulgare]|nr:hypothetical protein ZWY2020_029088 [Hordeum vulgare]